MSDWVNWQEFAALNEPEVQRQADDATATRKTQQGQMDTALANLTSEAQRRASEGNFQGVQSLGGYGQVMKARDEAQAANMRQPGALQRPAWEADLTQGRSSTFESPWAQLGARLNAGTNKAQAQSSNVNQRRQQAAAEAEQKRFNAEANAKNDAATGANRQSDAERYTAWSDAVNRSSATSGGYGAGAYYDAAAGRGPGPDRVNETPRTQRTQRMGYATPTNTDSNFGMNYGYSSGNDWNF